MCQPQCVCEQHRYRQRHVLLVSTLLLAFGTFNESFLPVVSNCCEARLESHSQMYDGLS